MRALLGEACDPPDKLVVRELPPPPLRDTDALVDVKAAGLSFGDTLIIRGAYQCKPDLPFSPGRDLAGVVSATGPEVTAFAPGDRVMGFSIWGRSPRIARLRPTNCPG